MIRSYYIYEITKSYSQVLNSIYLNMREDTFETLCSKHVEDLTTSLKHTVASLGDVAASMAAVRESVLTEPKKNVIITAISEASSRSADGSAPKCSMANQEMMHMQHYLSEWDWTVLMDETATTAKKVETIVHRCRTIGLLSMSERSSAAVATLIYKTIGNENIGTYNDILGKLKIGMKKMRALAKGDHEKQTLDRFPPDVQKFLQLHPGRYDEGSGPVPSTIGASDLASAVQAMPCRKSHTFLKGIPSISSA